MPLRGRQYALFATVILAIALPGAVVMHERLRTLVPPAGALWLDCSSSGASARRGLHLASLVTARLRSPAFRYGVSIPGMVFVAAGALAGVWLLALLPLRLCSRLSGSSGCSRRCAGSTSCRSRSPWPRS